MEFVLKEVKSNSVVFSILGWDTHARKNWPKKKGEAKRLIEWYDLRFTTTAFGAPFPPFRWQNSTAIHPSHHRKHKTPKKAKPKAEMPGPQAAPTVLIIDLVTCFFVKHQRCQIKRNRGGEALEKQTTMCVFVSKFFGGKESWEKSVLGLARKLKVSPLPPLNGFFDFHLTKTWGFWPWSCSSSCIALSKCLHWIATPSYCFVEKIMHQMILVNVPMFTFFVRENKNMWETHPAHRGNWDCSPS